MPSECEASLPGDPSFHSGCSMSIVKG